MDPQEGEQLHQILGYVYDKKGASVNTNEIAQTLSITRNVAYKLTDQLVQQGDVVNCSSKDNIDTLNVFSTSKTKIAYLSDKYRDKKRNLLTRYNDGVKIPVLFLSYSWDNQTEAEIIYNDLTQIGIKIIKDNHDLNYKDDLDNFMQSIRNADFAIILLSDAYLKSKNCMNEIQHLLKEQDIKKKILPIVIDGTKLFSAIDRLLYVQHWEEKEEILRNRVAKVNPLNALDILADLKSVGQISASIDSFIKEVTRMLTFKFSEMKGEKYLSLLTAIGFENVTWATDLLEIIGIESAQKRDILLDAYSEKHPLNTYYYTLKATTNQKNGRFDQAKFNFQQAIKFDSKNVEALNNLGFLLENKYQEFKLAKEYYEAALDIDDKLVVARINLANILVRHFNQIIEAKTHYEHVIDQDPSEKKAYNNLANLYSRDYPDPSALVKAYELYEKALQIDKNYVEAYINLSKLLLKEGRLIEVSDVLESAKNADRQGIYSDHINNLIAKTTL